MIKRNDKYKLEKNNLKTYIINLSIFSNNKKNNDYNKKISKKDETIKYIDKGKKYNKIKIIYTNNKFNNIIFKLLLILTKKNNRYLISNIYQVTLKLYGIGDQQIINDKFKYIPSSIYINGNPINLQNRKIKNITTPNNTIIMNFNFNIVITDCSYMFYNISNITSIDLSNFDSSNVLNMSYMFSYSNKLQYINFPNFNTFSVLDMSYMFYNCFFLLSLDLSSFNTYNVIKMTSMFQHCSKLESININSFRTPSLKNISYRFAYCNSLTSLNLSLFNTSFVNKLNFLFYQCYNL